MNPVHSGNSDELPVPEDAAVSPAASGSTVSTAPEDPVTVTPEMIGRHLQRSGSKLILMHESADPDALGSAAALAVAFPGTDIGVFVGLSASARQMAEKLEITVIDEPDASRYDTVIVVDCSTPSQIAAPLTHPDVVVIDHHANTGAWGASEWSLVYIDESKVSCAEIVHRILGSIQGLALTREQCVFLLCGMLTDSGHFRFAKADTLSTAAELLAMGGIELPEIHPIVETETYFDVSRRVAMLKAAQRCAIEQVGQSIIATSVVGAFEAQCSRGLMLIGADIALIGSQKKKKFRVSARAKPHIIAKGIHLGTLMNDVASEMGAEGGGHDAAAGMKGSGDAEAMLHVCRERLKRSLLDIRKHEKLQIDE